jgi:nucleoside-diphosphate-sugar epimerase
MKVLYDCVMKIVVTGVAGLLGSHYSRWMADLGHDVIGIDNLSGGYESNISLEEGIKDLITWIEHSPRRDFKYDIELEIKNSLTPITWLKKEI